MPGVKYKVRQESLYAGKTMSEYDSDSAGENVGYAVKPDMQTSEKDFAYVSVLYGCHGYDLSGGTAAQTSVGDYHSMNAGLWFVYREQLGYMEYSFNEYEDIEKLASTITETLKQELSMMEELELRRWRPG